MWRLHLTPARFRSQPEMVFSALELKVSALVAWICVPIWQIVPKQLGELMGDPDPEKSGRVMQAMLKMQKIIVADLKNAYDGV